MNNDITTYYFNSEIWDAPEIVDNEGNIIDTLNVCSNMYSWIVIKGKVYVCYEKSHYGAIENALMSIHHLDNVEQIERKFGESIDDICEEIRYSNTNQCEGRFWCKYNIIECTGGQLSNDIIKQVCQLVGCDINNAYILNQSTAPYYNLFPIEKCSEMNATQNVLREYIDRSLLAKFKPTVQWMSEMYNKANTELFNGVLGDCIFKAEPIRSNTDWLGSFGISSGRYGCKLYAGRNSRRIYLENYLGGKEYVDSDNFFELCRPTITLSTYYSGTEETLYATLVHEMCHYYTYRNGYYPRQAHGPEFRSIGATVAYRSNGQLTVQRIATAEQMEGYDMDDELKQKKERIASARKMRAHYYLIVWKNGRVALTNPTDACLRSIIGWEQRNGSKVKEILDIKDPEITNELYDKYGFTKKMRTYRFWAEKAGITQENQIIKRILNNSNTYKIILENE